MRKTILAALICSAVLFIAVSPVYARQPAEPVEFQPMLKDKPVGSNEVDITDRDPVFLQGWTTLSGNKPRLDEFAKAVITGDPGRITGLFVPEYGGFYVVQQKASLDGSVSPVQGVITQYKKPSAGGVTGLLAHNYGAGKWFNEFEPGEQLFVITGDGKIKEYRLREKLQYQALDGKNMLTDFLEIPSGRRLTASQVYTKTYTGAPHLTLQTCIQSGDDLTWGRLFLIADPV